VVWQPVITWESARQFATTLRHNTAEGYLATLTSREEDLHVELLRQAVLGISDRFENELWVGGYELPDQSNPSDGWFWLNGEGLIPGINGGGIYANWLPGEPDDCCDPNGSNLENHLSIGRDGQFGWNSQRNSLNILGFVVEFDGESDRDGDGVPDQEDAHPDSNLSTTVVIDNRDSGVLNLWLGGGSTLTDLITEAAVAVRNHGAFVKVVSRLANQLTAAGLITSQESGQLRSTAAQARLP